MTAIATAPAQVRSTTMSGTVPMRRLVQVELRKMFDTRSGFWLLASIGIAGLAATVATIMFAPDEDLTYYTFAKSIGFPMTVLLPIIAVLAITSEWSQRTGLTTFTLVPHRSRVIMAKIMSSITVAVASMLFAFAVGAVGNVIGTAIAGTPQVWDVSAAEGVNIVLGNLLCLLTGTVLGLLIRSSAAALVVYFVYSLLVPSIAELLATSQEWFRDVRPWVDLNFAQSHLFEGALTGQQWAQVAVTAAIWVLLPGLLGLRLVLRSEVK
jgi:ABC-type transport system involved in multi-copper enzyme maturation permease subunit